MNVLTSIDQVRPFDLSNNLENDLEFDRVICRKFDFRICLGYDLEFDRVICRKFDFRICLGC